MTPEQMAALHARCFTWPRPWSAAEFASVLDASHIFAETAPGGFAIGQVVAGEGELLTLAVEPELRRQGIGRALLARVEESARQRGAERLFLEVAEDNPAAIALYRQSGYAATGRRRGYYRVPEGQNLDAILMEKALIAG